MLNESNLLEFIFQGSLHSNKRVAVHVITISEEKGRKDAQAQLVVPDASCGESLAMVSHFQQHVGDGLSWVLLSFDVL